jgi:hypothetical protein
VLNLYSQPVLPVQVPVRLLWFRGHIITGHRQSIGRMCGRCSNCFDKVKNS